MSDGVSFRWLHALTLRVQVPLVLASIPVAVCLYGIAVAPAVVDVAMIGSSDSARAAARDALWIVVGMLVICASGVTIGSALLVRGSIRTVIERMQVATTVIASGDFAHRIGEGRSDELGSLAASIDVMAERLERLEQSRRQLLACISHELRTPLTIIRGQAFAMSRCEVDAGRRSRLSMIEEESARLATLIEDLVDASSLQAGGVRLCFDRVDLVALTRSTVERFRESASYRGVRIELEEAAGAFEVDIDPGRIEQVLANLVANAVRHADVGSAITIRIAPASGDTPRTNLIVVNRGGGISRALAARIFEPFIQGPCATGRVGLGLAIAHGLASAHGGSLTLASTGERTGVVAFQLALPAASPADRAAHDVRSRAARRYAMPRLQVGES